MTAEPTIEAAYAAIDAANADDPTRVEVDGTSWPKEVLHAQLMTGWVLRLCPDAQDAQLLAARAHHLRRWETPRDDYPRGRAGYLRWKRAAARAQSDAARELLAGLGWPEPTLERVVRIMEKRDLRHDAAVQTHEDALCLVFLETQLVELSETLGDDHTIEVLRKTLPKMSAAGVRAAGSLELSERGAELVAAAVASSA